MMWEDVVFASLLALGLFGLIGQLRDPKTQVPYWPTAIKAMSALGMGILQIHLGLSLTALVSITHYVLFVFMLRLRPIRGAWE